MSRNISTLRVRAKLGGLLNRVVSHQEEFVIERKGRPMAALVPVQKFERMKNAARRYGLEFLEGQKGKGLSQRQADRLAGEAVEWARGGGRSRKRPRS